MKPNKFFTVVFLLTISSTCFSRDASDLSRYVSTFKVDDNEVLDAWSKAPEKSTGLYSSIRLQGRSSDDQAVTFFHGPSAYGSWAHYSKAEGINFNLKDYYRDRLDAKLFELTETRKERQERIGEIDQKIRYYNRGEIRMSPESIEKLREEQTVLEKLNKENLPHELKLKRVLSESEKFEEKTKESAELYRDLMQAVLGSCPRQGEFKLGIHVCKGKTATYLSDLISDIRQHDEKLKGTIYEGLQVGPILGNPKDIGNNTVSAGDSYLLNIHGVLGYTCFPDADTHEPICQIVTDNLPHDPAKDINTMLAARMKDKPNQVVAEERIKSLSPEKSFAEPKSFSKAKQKDDTEAGYSR